MKKTILVTGSAGFIGFHTSIKLLKEGNKVIGVDNLNSYYDPKIKKKRNRILKKYKSYKFYKLDFSNFKKINNVIKKEKPKVIVHLAAQAGVRYSLTNPWAYENANNLGTLNIFESAKLNKIKRVVFASSSSVYGGNKKLPFSEKDRTDTPISLYAASKKSNEVVGHTYHHLYGIETAGLRFFTVYGPYGRPDMALFKFTKNILLSKKIDVYNKGKMGRDFTYIDDIVDGINSVINKKKLEYEIYNLGGDNPIELMKFISLIEKNLNKKAKIKFLGMQAGDVKKTYADISKAKKEINYKPKVKVEEGVENFCNWFLKNESWLLKLKESKQ